MELNHRVLPRLGLLAALVLLATLLLSVGSAYARYRTEARTAVDRPPLVFQSAPDSVLTIAGNELREENGAWINRITVRNENGEALRFTPRTMVSLGIGDSDNAEVSLTIVDSVYAGVGESILPGSFLYDSFGEGWYFWYMAGSGELLLTLGADETMVLEISIQPQEGQSFPADSKVQTDFIIQH